MIGYVNRAPYTPVKPKTKRSIQVGFRIPIDLVGPMDSFCRARKLRRTDLVVAALRAHLKTPAPADIPAKEK